jgi:hypothetical protein
MTSWQRGNILKRAEKGIGPVSFKRLLMAGGAGALVAMLGSRLLGFTPACLSAGVVLAVALAITHPVEGLALLAYAAQVLRGWVALAALHGRGGALGALGRALHVAPDEGVLQADQVYGAAGEDDGGEPLLGGEWAYLGGFADVDDRGLAAVDDPFAQPKPQEGA